MKRRISPWGSQPGMNGRVAVGQNKDYLRRLFRLVISRLGISMNVLIVGGAGHVGSIIRPDFEHAHRVHYYDIKPVPGGESRTTIADVNDAAMIERALHDQDAVIYLAMGRGSGPKRNANEVTSAFGVNACGFYRFLETGLRAGIRRFVYASTLDVYSLWFKPGPLPARDDAPTDAWGTYGMSKRLGEQLCLAAAQRYPDAVIIAMRLCCPCNDKGWPGNEYRNELGMKNSYMLGPNDTRRIFLQAVQCERRGAHLMNATGDVEKLRFMLDNSEEILGWKPRGE